LSLLTENIEVEREIEKERGRRREKERAVLSDIKIDPSTSFLGDTQRWIHRFVKNIGRQIDQFQVLIISYIGLQ